MMQIISNIQACLGEMLKIFKESFLRTDLGTHGTGEQWNGSPRGS